MELSSKQRSYLMGLSQTVEPIMQIGKASVTPEVVQSAEEVFNNRELIKISVLKNCEEDVRLVADKLSKRTHAVLVQCIGRRFILYRPFKDPADRRIVLPK